MRVKRSTFPPAPNSLYAYARGLSCETAAKEGSGALPRSPLPLGQVSKRNRVAYGSCGTFYKLAGGGIVALVWRLGEESGVAW